MKSLSFKFKSHRLCHWIIAVQRLNEVQSLTNYNYTKMSIFKNKNPRIARISLDSRGLATSSNKTDNKRNNKFRNVIQ